MARNAKTPASATRSAQAGAKAAGGASGEPSQDGMAAAREWVTGSLAAAHDAAGWMEELQRLNMQAASAWAQTLAMGSREVGQAGDPYQLMSVSARIVNQQFEEMSRQFASATQRLFDTQARWMDRLREQATGQAQRLQVTLPGASKPDAGPENSALAALGQAQDEWLAMTRRWIETINTATTRRANL